jgi:hypothetical protein
MGLVTSGYYIVCSQQTGYVGSKKGFVLAISFCLFFFSKVSATEEFLTDSSYDILQKPGILSKGPGFGIVCVEY